MDRLQLINNQLGQLKYVSDSLSFLKLTELLTPQEEAFRRKVREYAEKEVAPTINDFVETATFPEQAVKKMRDYKLLEALLKPPFGQGGSTVQQGLALAELSRVDAGLGTFFAVQFALLASTLELLGSEAQKQKYLTKVRDVELIGGWGLTEAEFGSDASSLETRVKKVQGGYILNGNKRWIGNGNQDLVIIWARNEDNKNIEGFIVENKWKGVKSEPIKHKLSLRIVQNCQLHFENVFVPDENKLEKAKDFNSGPNTILLNSRIGIPWISVGICMGVYDNVVKYISERKQFKVPLSSFQLQQERLVRIMANTQAVFLMTYQNSRLADQGIHYNYLFEGKTTIGVSSGVKAWVTSVTRDVARLGREMMGGNGIITDNYCIKALADAEGVYTYEGTYDINCLVAARELTGIAAFKTK